MRKNRVNSIKPDCTESVASGEVRLLSGAGEPTALVFQPPPHDESKHVTQSTSEQYAPLGLTTPALDGRARANSRTKISTSRLVIVTASIQSELIASLSRQAEIAYALRQLDRVEAVSKQLEQIHMPVAYYWQGLAAQQQGAGNLDHAQKLLEQAINHAPGYYQARALLALGSIAEYKGDYKAEAEFYRAALAHNRSDLFTSVETRRAQALAATREGNHQKTAQILEPIWALVRHNPFLKAQLLNHLAVAYQNIGRLHEAMEFVRFACASPFAAIYHEFRETRAEIEQDIAKTQAQAIAVVVPARLPEQKQQQKVIIHFQYVESRARRKVIKPTIGRAPVVHSIIERVATVAPIHAPPFNW